MRKCESCGYLVLHEGEICKHCGGLLPRVSTLATIGGPPPPAPPAHAPATGHARSSMPPTPTSFAAPPFERAQWELPSPVPANATRSAISRAVVAFVVIASLALGWTTVGGLLGHDKLPAGTKAFVAGHGVPFSSPDHSFDIEFPKQPTLIRRTFPIASTASTLNLAQTEGDDYEVIAASMAVPIRMSDGEVDDAMDQILETGSQDADITSRKKVTIQGAPGIEIRAKLKDGYAARIVVVVSRSRFYLLGVHSRSATDRLYDALISSLIIY